ncbi:MAG TPA: DUF5666 domain-containing protein [Anaerolineae bacterium]
MPDRPPIMMPTLAPLPSEPPIATLPTEKPEATTAISGTITIIADNFIVVGSLPVSFGPDTRINGQLKAGAFVQVEAKIRANGELEANKLDVTEELAAPHAALNPTDQLQVQPVVQATVQPTAPQERGSDGNLQVRPPETPEAHSTEKPQVKPADQPTEDLQVKQRDQPEVHPTEKSGGNNSHSDNNGGPAPHSGADSEKNWNPGSYGDSSKNSGGTHPED